MSHYPLPSLPAQAFRSRSSCPPDAVALDAPGPLACGPARTNVRGSADEHGSGRRRARIRSEALEDSKSRDLQAEEFA
ncbi:MAG: hypothetical protein LUQ59_01740 [Methanothrix sp.]|nr:hypothetical protein [Methanothrix sp.]